MVRYFRMCSIGCRFSFLLLTCILTCNGNLPAQTNFVFLLVDDLGWTDLGCFGSQFYETPNIDSLCKSGMKFTQAYAAASVCSPTRASIMTGRHPVRVNITDWIPGRPSFAVKEARFHHVEDRDNLDLSEVTIAEFLKLHGYRTFFAGKWHLGSQGHWPTDQGFDVNIGGNATGQPAGGYYSPWKNPTLQTREPNEYLTERLTSESVQFLKNQSTKQPFLLFLSYYNVHTPITPYRKRFHQFDEKAKDLFQDEAPVIAEHNAQTKTRQDNAAYASMIAAVDDSVGTILETLDRLHLRQDTVVIFFSDNGGLSTLRTPGPTSNLPLRSGKGWLYEGGIREPMIVRAPQVTRPGSVCDAPVVSMDFFPTILELAGLPPSPQLHADGKSLISLLKGERPSSQRTLYWHYPHYHGSLWTPGAAIRAGDWKLIEFYHHDKVELYHLGDDPGESHDLHARHPEKRESLRRRLRDWQQQLNASMPEPLAG